MSKRHAWTEAEIALLRAKFPDVRTADLAIELGCSYSQVAAKAEKLGVHKSATYLASAAACRLRRGDNVGAASRFPKGHVPANKGLRRPGWAPGRMRETQFKKGAFPINKDPEFYVLGALKVNSDGYIDMRISFEPGALGWRALHKILWEDAHGPVPRGHCLIFKDGDKLNVELDNIELITLAANMRRNTVHNLPAPLVQAIQLRGALVRQINKREGKHGQDDR